MKGEPLQAKIRQRTKEKMTEAYDAFLAKEPGSEDHLLEVVRKFVLAKAMARIADLGEASENAEDMAQDVLIAIWTGLADFGGEAESFYAWVHRIGFRRFSRAAGEIKGQVDAKVDLVLDDPEEPDYKVDNPALRPERRPLFARELPEWIVGKDLWICQLLREGLTQKAISEVLGCTQDSIEKRIARMRARNLEEEKNHVPLPNRLGRDIVIPGPESRGTRWAGVPS